jgi:hypothetical protein
MRQATYGVPPDTTIEPDHLYPREELKRRLGWSDSSLRAAIRRGLVGHRSGKSWVFIGRNVIRYHEAQTTTGVSR